MSQRTYVSPDKFNSVCIESIGAPDPKSEDEDVWRVTHKMGTIEFPSILWSSQVKELVAKLEEQNWTKETAVEKDPEKT
jgi:hypothetical protein